MIRKKRPAKQSKLVNCKAYRQAIGCLNELGEATLTVETELQCKAILNCVMDIGIVLARADLHRRTMG